MLRAMEQESKYEPKNIITMRKLNSLLFLLLLAFICPSLAQAQLQRSEAFKGKYKLN